MNFFYDPFSEEEIAHIDGETWGASLITFNNFFCNFPWSQDIMACYRIQRLSDRNKEKLGAYKYPELRGDKNGEKFIRITWQEFYKDLDEAVVTCGFTMENVVKEITRWKKFDSNDEERKKIDESIFKIFAPIYKAMRNKGYGANMLTT
jgi:hypothetical protein